MATTLEAGLVQQIARIKTIQTNALLRETPFEDGVLPITAGGTGATSAAAALSALGGVGSGHTHAAADIVSGTIAAARLGSGTANSGTLLHGDNTWSALAAGDIPSLPASQITSGTIAAARLGSGTASATTLLHGDSTWGAIVAADIPSLDAAKITTGTLAAARLGASPTAAKLLFGDNTWAILAAADIPSLPASIITSGTLGAARLASGSAASGTFLRGDQVWTSGLAGGFSATTISASSDLDCNRIQTNLGVLYNFGAFTSSGDSVSNGSLSMIVNGTTYKVMTKA